MASTADSFELPAELTFATAGALLKQLRGADKAAQTLDLGQVRRIDHAGLALLVYWLGQNAPGGRTPALTNVPEVVSQLAGLNRVADLFEGDGLDSGDPKPIS